MLRTRKSRGVAQIRPRDYKKELDFKRLCELLLTAGYQVRREKLKQGHGWKVVSGTCRAEDSRLVFVDQKMSQDEQLSFLKLKIKELGIELADS